MTSQFAIKINTKLRLVPGAIITRFVVYFSFVVQFNSLYFHSIHKIRQWNINKETNLFMTIKGREKVNEFVQYKEPIEYRLL